MSVVDLSLHSWNCIYFKSINLSLKEYKLSKIESGPENITSSFDIFSSEADLQLIRSVERLQIFWHDYRSSIKQSNVAFKFVIFVAVRNIDIIDKIYAT